jgi:hypothetical protein
MRSETAEATTRHSAILRSQLPLTVQRWRRRSNTTSAGELTRGSRASVKAGASAAVDGDDEGPPGLAGP